MKGVHHLGLAVADLEATRRFFCELLGWREVHRNDDYPSVFVSNGSVMFTLWQTNPGAKDFDRRNNVGLHHVALAVESEEELEDIYRRLAGAGEVEIEFAPESVGAGPARHFICREPGGIRIEFIHAP